jgi:hypothetical protein
VRCKDIHALSPIDVKHGLSGIGLGIHFLIKNRFVKGNLNVILKDIDDAIFKKLTSNEYYNSVDALTLIHLLCYWYVRLQEQKNESEMQWLYKELTIQLINEIYKKIDYSFCEAPLFYTIDYPVPLFLFILSKFYELNFYSDTIRKLLDEFSYVLFSTIPLLNANKLYLFWGLDTWNKVLPSKKTKDYIRLIRNLNMQTVLTHELRNHNVFFKDGLVSIYFLLSALKEYFDKEEYKRYCEIIIQKIKTSDVWKLLAEDSPVFFQKRDLFDGYCGTSLFIRMLDT